jgi:hypothetical protein
LPADGSASSISTTGFRITPRFSINRLERFRESDILHHIFERIVAACMVNGLIKGEGFAVDASVMEANATRYSWQGARGTRLDGRAAPEAGGSGVSGGDTALGARRQLLDERR